MEILLRDFTRLLPYRSEIVEHPESASVSCQYQVVAFHHQVVYGRSRQVELELFPIRAVVVADVHAGFGARIQQSLSLGIFSHGAHEAALRDAFYQHRPRLAEVNRLEDVRLKIVQPMTID